MRSNLPRRLVPLLPLAVVPVLLLAAGGGVAHAAPDDAGTTDDCRRVVARQVSGSTAVDALGPDLPAVARAHGRTSAELEQQLTADDALTVLPCGDLAFVDPRPHLDDEGHEAEDPQVLHSEQAVGPTLLSGWDAAPALAASQGTDVLALHSRPGADRVIHLDVTGPELGALGTVTWFGGPLVLEGTRFPAFDIDGDPSTLTATERAAVYEMWARVAEDFAPWDVDVTTERPPSDDLVRSEDGDERYGVSTVISSRGSSRGGIAFVDVLGEDPEATQGSVTFTGLGAEMYSPQYIATIVSHEVGHNLDLLHHSTLVAPGGDYHPGNATWTPIMGNGGAPLSHWADGQWVGSTNGGQADLAVIGRHLPLAPDPDEGPSQVQVNRPVQGLLRTGDEEDRWTVDVVGLSRVRVTASTFGPNLDPRLRVYDSSTGQLRRTYDPPLVAEDPLRRPSTLDIDEVLDIPGTSFTLVVDAVSGAGWNPSTGGFLGQGHPDYGNVGPYTLLVTYEDTTPPVFGDCPAGGPFLLNASDSTVGPITVQDVGSGIADQTLTATVDTTAARTRTVTFTATNGAGLTARKDCDYRVDYAFSGFLAPVDNPPVVNTGRSGRTYPVKFRLSDADGAPVTDLSAVSDVRTVRADCGTWAGEGVSALEATASGGTGLRYDSSAGHYVYNWTSPRSRGCYTLVVSLDSGQPGPGDAGGPTAYFDLR